MTCLSCVIVVVIIVVVFFVVVGAATALFLYEESQMANGMAKNRDRIMPCNLW